VSGVSDLEESAVVVECGDVVSVGAESDVPVGSNCKKGVFFEAEEGGSFGFEIADVDGQVARHAEAMEGFEQGRVGGELL